MKYQNFITKLTAVFLIGVFLYHYQTVARARAELIAKNEAKIAEIEAYNREIEKENARRMEDAEGGPAEETLPAEYVFKDGTYEGTGTGYGGEIRVSVTIKSDVLTDFQILSHDGEDPAYYSLAESLTDTVLREQSTDVDTVSGATFSSKGILEALDHALDEAVNE